MSQGDGTTTPVVVPAILRDGVGRLPAVVDRSAQRWGLRLGSPFTDGASSWCAPAVRSDGQAVVLKLSFPHDEARHEAAALRAWHGHGVPRLLGAHDADWALLLER